MAKCVPLRGQIQCIDLAHKPDDASQNYLLSICKLGSMGLIGLDPYDGLMVLIQVGEQFLSNIGLHCYGVELDPHNRIGLIGFFKDKPEIGQVVGCSGNLLDLYRKLPIGQTMTRPAYLQKV